MIIDSEDPSDQIQFAKRKDTWISPPRVDEEEDEAGAGSMI